MSSDYPERERYYPEMPPKRKLSLPGNYPDSVVRHPSGSGFATPIRVPPGPANSSQNEAIHGKCSPRAPASTNTTRRLPGNYPDICPAIMQYSSATSSNAKRIIKTTTTNYTLMLVKPTYRRTKTAYPDPEHPENRQNE